MIAKRTMKRRVLWSHAAALPWRVAATTVVLALVADAAFACSVCYGEAAGPMIDAARLGVGLLIGCIVLMQVSFAWFFVYLWRRAARHQETDTLRAEDAYLADA